MLFNLVSLDGVAAQELKVGTKKVMRKLAEKVEQTEPSFYNDGLGGTRVKRTTEDLVYDYLGRYVGKRTINEDVLTTVNDNGKVYIPKKPFVMKKEIEMETADGSKHTVTAFDFQSGIRKSKRNCKTGETTYYNLSNGLPLK